MPQLQASGDFTLWHMTAELFQQQRSDMQSQSLKPWPLCGQSVHFYTYLYGNDVTIYTDHSAVKAVLESSAMHA